MRKLVVVLAFWGLSALAGCAAQNEAKPENLITESDIVTSALRSCQGVSGLQMPQCVEQFQLAHQKWNVDCRRRTLSAAASVTGRDEFSPWCIITANHAFFAQVLVEKQGVSFRNISDFSASCGYGPKISIDGKAIDREEALVDAMRHGERAMVQKQASWPSCLLHDRPISLVGLDQEIASARAWVEGQDL